MATQGKVYTTSQTHYVNAELEYSDFAVSGASLVIGVIPKDSLIVRHSAYVYTAFSASAASIPGLTIGDGTATAQSNRFVTTTTGSFTATVGLTTLTTGLGICSAELNLTVTLTTGQLGVMPTTGKMRYIMEYIPPNDVKSLESGLNN